MELKVRLLIAHDKPQSKGEKRKAWDIYLGQPWYGFFFCLSSTSLRRGPEPTRKIEKDNFFFAKSAHSGDRIENQGKLAREGKFGQKQNASG